MAVAVAAGLTLFVGVRPGPAGESRPHAVKPGAACTHLRRAQAYLGNPTQFHASAAAAGLVAEEALLGSGAGFGRPERAALELRRGVEEGATGGPEVAHWLDEGLRACPA